MKKRILIGVLITVIVLFFAAFIFCSVFFTMKGLHANEQQWIYFDHYQAIAEKSIRNDPEMIAAYGEDFEFELRYVYTTDIEGGTDSLFDLFRDVFDPWTPESLEEFNNYIETMQFVFTVEENEYEIAFEKDATGAFAVKDIRPTEKTSQ